MSRFLCTLAILLCAESAFAQDPFEKGKVALATHDTTLAITCFKDALKLGRKSSESNTYLGLISLARGDVGGAISYLQEAVNRDGENTMALSALGNAFALRKEYRNALTSYRRAVRYAPKDATLRLGIGTVLLAIDSIDAAIVQLTTSQEYDPNNADIYSALGDAYAKQNVLVLAISKYQKAAELNPKDFATRRKLAAALFKNRQYNESVAEYDAMIAIDSTFAGAYLEKGRIYFLAKQYKKAIPPLQQLVRRSPTSIEGTALLARALFGADEFPQAAAASKVALALDSNNVELWRVQAASLTKTRECEPALAAFAALKRRNALKTDDYADYGNALVCAGREDEAIKILQEALRADSTNCDLYFPIGTILMNKHDWTGAAQMFENKVSCDPRSLSSYINAAACYMQLKSMSRARELLVHAVELKSDFLQARLWLGRYYAQVDSLEKAVEQYDEVLKIIAASPDPQRFKRETAEAHQQKGQLYFINRRYEQAIDSFRKAQAVGAENSGLHLMWGQGLLQLLNPHGDDAENTRLKEDAIMHFRRAVATGAANDAQPHLWLGQGLILARKEGEYDKNKKLVEEACAELTKALRLDPRNDDAKKSMERIGCK